MNYACITNTFILWVWMRIFLSNAKLSFCYWLPNEVNLTTISVNNLCNQFNFFDQSQEYETGHLKIV